MGKELDQKKLREARHKQEVLSISAIASMVV